MPEEITVDSAGNAPTPVSAVPAPTMPQPVSPATVGENWQERFKGLQQALQTTLQQTGWGKLDAIPKKPDVETWQQASTQLGDLRIQFEALSQERVALQTDLTAQAARAVKAEREARKALLVSDVAPQLSKLVNYIPTTEDDAAQTAAINEFLTRMSTAVQPASIGALPPPLQPQAGGSQLGTSDVWTLLQAEIQKGSKADPAELARLKELWYKE